MSAQIKDGGPAFPHQDSGDTGTRPGMSLRDYFAAKAMHDELMTCGVPGDACAALVTAMKKSHRTPEEQIAWNAYEMADAMLRAREVQA